MTQTLERMIKTVSGMFSNAPQTPESDGAARLLAAPRRWMRLLAGPPEWSETPTLNLPSAIAGEVARLATMELDAHVSGGPRAAFLNRQLQPVLSALRTQCEFAAGCGGVMMKPFVENGQIAVDFALPGSFLPTDWDSRGRITGAVFVEKLVTQAGHYTRLEHHKMQQGTYTVENRAFRSSANNVLGKEVPLDSVPRWAALSTFVTLTSPDGRLQKPLFSYFKMPLANTHQPDSPLGMSVYGRAENLLEEADRQYGRILWEYEGSELAVDASVGAIQPQGKGFTMPQGRKRLFRELAVTGPDGGDLYRVFSPAIRDESLFRGLDNLLKRIEFACCLSYGTLSDPQSVAKTAEEIKMSKQRSYAAVCDIQKALRRALEDLLAAMDAYATLYNLAPAGSYQLTIRFGDGVTVDSTTERQQLREDCLAGAACWWEYRMKFYGESEEEARRRAAEAREEHRA